ncbi:MAG: TonB family protein [Lysobacter sp.]|nr:TonB family protein [Lysobacter sp.]
MAAEAGAGSKTAGRPDRWLRRVPVFAHTTNTGGRDGPRTEEGIFMKQIVGVLVFGAVALVAAASVAAEQPLDISAGIDPSSRRLNPAKYPTQAIEACVDGTVIVVVQIDKNGEFSKATVERSGGQAYFDEAALEAAKHWTYFPAVEGGQPVPGKIRVPVDFPVHDRCWASVEVDVEARPDSASMKANPPKWPAAVKDEKLRGNVVLLIQVDRDGGRKNLKVGVSSGRQDIDEAAMLAALQWFYRPAVLDGEPVASVLHWPVYYGQKTPPAYR